MVEGSKSFSGCQFYLGEKFWKITGAVGEVVGDPGLLEHGSENVCKGCVFSVFEILAMLEAKATSSSKHERIIFVRVRSAVTTTINNGGLIEQGNEELDIAIFDYSFVTGGGFNDGKPGTGATYATSAVYFCSTKLDLPQFVIQPEKKFHQFDKFQDFDFIDYPKFSEKYLLQGSPEESIRKLFNKELIEFFESISELELSVEGGGDQMIIYNQKRIDPKAHKIKIFAYSPSQNIAYIIPEYSVWYPATSSASASGKSKGGLFVSAKADIKNTTNIGNKGTTNHNFSCAKTISFKFKDPTHRSTLIIIIPIETS